MGDPLIDKTIDQILWLHNMNPAIHLTSTNTVIDRFRSHPEKFLYFMCRRFLGDFFGWQTYICMTKVDIYPPVTTQLSAMEDFYMAESASSGLFVSRVIRDRVLLVINLLTRHAVRIHYPRELSVSHQIGHVQIFVNEADATYVIWFCVYSGHDQLPGMCDTDMFLYRSATKTWTPLGGITLAQAQHWDVLVIDRDVSAYLIEPVYGAYYLKFAQGGDHSHGPITHPTLPQGCFPDPLFVPTFIHFAFIAGEVWALQPDVVHHAVNGLAEKVCFLSVLCVDDTAEVTNEQQRCYRTRAMRWHHRQMLLDPQLMALVFDPAGGIGTVNKKRFLVTADSQYFFVCSRNDAVVLRVSPLGGHVDMVVEGGNIARPREKVFAVTPSFIAPFPH